MKKDILGAIIERRERINSAHIPTWDKLPSLNLYMDQLIFILSEIFEPYFDDVPKLINKAIINNYVKLGYIPAPVKKKYSKEHIAVVCSLKQVMPIAAISALVKAQTEKIPLSEFYDNFCANREKAVLAALAIDAPSMKDKGKVMKELMPRVKGRADGGMVNKIVGEVLNGEK